MCLLKEVVGFMEYLFSDKDLIVIIISMLPYFTQMCAIDIACANKILLKIMNLFVSYFVY